MRNSYDKMGTRERRELINVTERQWCEIRRILSTRIPDCEVRAFGSRVKGFAKPWADPDAAAVVGPEVARLRGIGRLIGAFQGSTLPFRVGVLDWHDVSPSFRAITSPKQYAVIQTGQIAGVTE